MYNQTIKVPTYLNGINEHSIKEIYVNQFSTPRSIIRRAKSVHRLSNYRHKAKQFTGTDGGEYISLSFSGLSFTLLIDLNGGQDDL